MNKTYKSKLGETFVIINNPSVDNFIEVDIYAQPNKFHRPLHFHPNQSEYFKILSGEIKLQVNKEIKTLTEGQELTIPPNTNHLYFNDTHSECIIKTRLTPALDFEEFLDTIINLETHHPTDNEGVPQNKFLAAMFLTRFKHIIRPANIPSFVVDLIFPIMTRVGNLAGLKLKS